MFSIRFFAINIPKPIPFLFLEIQGSPSLSIISLGNPLPSSDITKKYNEMTGESESYDYDTRHTILEMQVDLDLKGFEDKEETDYKTK